MPDCPLSTLHTQITIGSISRSRARSSRGRGASAPASLLPLVCSEVRPSTVERHRNERAEGVKRVCPNYAGEDRALSTEQIPRKKKTHSRRRRPSLLHRALLLQPAPLFLFFFCGVRTKKKKTRSVTETRSSHSYPRLPLSFSFSLSLSLSLSSLSLFLSHTRAGAMPQHRVPDDQALRAEQPYARTVQPDV